MATITITGNTYPVREQLKAMGGRWNPAAKGWDVPAANAASARAAVLKAALPSTEPTARNSLCPNPRDCGDPCCNGSCGY